MWYTSTSSVARRDFHTEPNCTVSVRIGFGSVPTCAFFTSKTLVGGMFWPLPYCPYIDQ